MAAWIKRLGKVEAPPRVGGDAAIVVKRAALYEDLEHTDGWLDFIGMVQHYRHQLEHDLLYGRPGIDRTQANTDTDLRAMLFILGRILAIPADARARFDAWRLEQDLKERMVQRADHLTNPGVPSAIDGLDGL